MAAKQVGMLVATLFLARDIAHREHLKTDRYSRHVALGSFYEGVVDLADKLAEAWQGKFAQLLDIPLATSEGEMGILDLLEAQLEWIHEERYNAIDKTQTALHNIIDEIEALYMATLYKLRFLS